MMDVVSFLLTIEYFRFLFRLVDSASSISVGYDSIYPHSYCVQVSFCKKNKIFKLWSGITTVYITISRIIICMAIIGKTKLLVCC